MADLECFNSAQVNYHPWLAMAFPVKCKQRKNIYIHVIVLYKTVLHVETYNNLVVFLYNINTKLIVALYSSIPHTCNSHVHACDSLSAVM